MLPFSAAPRLPHILLHLEGIKSRLLNTLARLSSKDISNPRRLSLHPLKGVYTPFSRGPSVVVPSGLYDTRTGCCLIPLFGETSALRHSQMQEACTTANKFAAPGTLITDLVIFPFVQEYECALRHMTSIRSLHNCKLVCAVSAYIRLRPACRIYCCTSRVSKGLLNTLARLSSKDFFNPRRLSLHPLKGVYTPFSSVVVPSGLYDTRTGCCLIPLFGETSALRHSQMQ